jgi:hypothetical protein
MVGWNIHPKNQVAQFFKKISVYIFSELIYEFNHHAFYSMNVNDLYDVVY